MWKASIASCERQLLTSSWFSASVLGSGACMHAEVQTNLGACCVVSSDIGVGLLQRGNALLARRHRSGAVAARECAACTQRIPSETAPAAPPCVEAPVCAQLPSLICASTCVVPCLAAALVTRQSFGGKQLAPYDHLCKLVNALCCSCRQCNEIA